MIIEPSPSVSRPPFEAAERGELIVPCPLISRGRPTFSSNTSSVPAPGEALWLAVHAGVGPSRLLVSWAVLVGANTRDGSAPVPAAYSIESSATSTDGRDGEWRRELEVTQNAANARAHVIEFDGQSWVRLTLETPAPDAGAAALPDRFDLHDASDGTDDCWLVLGDALFTGALALAPTAAAATATATQPSWPELIHGRYPGYFPALIDETRLDESPAHTLDRLPDLLATHAAARRVAIAYGAGSSGEDSMEVGTALEAMVAAVLQSGRLPILARQPATRGRTRDAVDAFNRRIAALERRNQLVPGPDLAAWFDAHPDQLDDDGQPNLEGRRAVARLWADAVDVWYVPQ
jgi:hypothetical protein